MTWVFFGMHLVLRALCAQVPPWGGGAATVPEEGAVGFSALGANLSAGLGMLPGMRPEPPASPNP